jgi:aerobic carbon-monoxide dehydrogenase medium subunit
MYAFSYVSPKTVRQAASALAKADDGKFLAGGQTLLPTMKQRLAAPSTLVDLAKVEGLSGIELKGRALVIGAMTRHADVASSPIVQQAIPALAALAAGIGDPAVRHRGTLGGSLANNDPAADYPAAVLALNATVVTNKRKIQGEAFFNGLFETVLEPGEIVVKVSFPIPSKAAYTKFRNPASRYAIVGVFVAKRGSDVRVAVTGAGSGGVFRATGLEEALEKRFAPKSLDGVAVPATGLNSDIHASAEYRANLIAVMAKRAVAAAMGK